MTSFPYRLVDGWLRLTACALVGSLICTAAAAAEPNRDARIEGGNWLRVEISDLEAPGEWTVRVVIVREDGMARLPYLADALRAAGRTCVQLEQDIVDAYSRAKVVHRAEVRVSVLAKAPEDEGRRKP